MISNLGQVNTGVDGQTTSLAQAQHTVALGSPKMTTVLAWVGALTFVGYAITRSRRIEQRANGADAPTLLAKEARRIQHRNAARRAASRVTP